MLRSKINSAKATVEKANSSKSEEDLLNAQKSIDILKDEYQEKDKVAFQENLDKIKKAIADEKARVKAEQEAKVRAEQERKALGQDSGLNQNNVFD
ncbi:hypothetical protein LSG16_11490 [Lactococcus cremoris]|uniref:hypothetical protein n=1 Tax=Lactococcus lactis subsp. cremoris TaxID=1359 RepID=UPI001E48B1B9|nr:hypothetical protein [Lactococcus cremoris]MCD6633450.1 hypothetical protein [Lactococcus cremoris]